MKEKWIMALYLSMLMPTVFLTGCSDGSAAAETGTTVESEISQENADEAETDDASEEAEAAEMSGETDDASEEGAEKSERPDGVLVQVTSVEEGTVSGEVLEMSGPGKPDGDGQPPEKPDGDKQPLERPDGDGQPPEKPVGDKQPPERPDGDGQPPERPDGTDKPQGKPDGNIPEEMEPEFFASGENIEFTITEETVITLDERGETAEGTADDITADDILEVVLDENGQAVSVVIRKK